MSAFIYTKYWHDKDKNFVSKCQHSYKFLSKIDSWKNVLERIFLKSQNFLILEVLKDRVFLWDIKKFTFLIIYMGQ